MEDKIKALLNIGMTDEQVMSVLGVSEDDILNALCKEESAEEQHKKAVEKSKQERIERIRAYQANKSYETFTKYKPLIENWDGSVAAFCKKYGIGQATVFKIKKAKTLEEYRSFHAEKNNKEKARKLMKTEQEPRKTEAPKEAEMTPTLIELRTMNDTLLRIAEALERKRGWFRK